MSPITPPAMPCGYHHALTLRVLSERSRYRFQCVVVLSPTTQPHCHRNFDIL